MKGIAGVPCLEDVGVDEQPSCLRYYRMACTVDALRVFVFGG